jgi:hypothetical protein
MKSKIALTALLIAAGTSPVLASPWAEVGDNQLRGDIELLAASGRIDNVTGQWPLSWDAIVPALQANGPYDDPALQAARQRVLTRAGMDQQPGLSAGLALDATNNPGLVYGFDGMGRGKGQAQANLSYNSASVAARLSLGAFSNDFSGRTTKLMPDDSFVSLKINDQAQVYAGWLSHWWGPGWISALALSNNARPVPQIGIQRAGGSSSWPILNLLGPWQAEFFIGLLDDPRIDRNTGYNAAHISFNPLPGLEIGLGRTEQICGEHHPCVPLRDVFNVNNDPKNTDHTNDEGEIDIRWSHAIFGIPSEFYTSLMNEDSSPFTHSGTTHLFGTTIFLPMPSGSPLRLTAEYTDSVPTYDIFSFGNVMHGFAYTNGDYVDGMRYRGRTLGFSLDSDSRLLSVQGSWTDPRGRFYEISLHKAQISNPHNTEGNVVTLAPVNVNMGEARVSLPLPRMKLDLAVRLQDDQPRPKTGFTASVEAALRIAL